jgi:oxazoline/thiazoline synthase
LPPAVPRATRPQMQLQAQCGRVACVTLFHASLSLKISVFISVHLWFQFCCIVRELIRIPEFKHEFRVAVTHPDLVFFIGESGYRVIRGRILYQIAPLINGKRSSSEIAKHFRGRLNPADIECALLLFEAEGFVAEAEEVPRGFSWRADFQSAKNSKLDELMRAKMPALHLVDDYLQKDLETLNRIALKKKKRWMIAKTAGTVLWFGPVFTPPDGPCWKCLAIRLKEKRRVDAFLKANRSREIRAALSANTQQMSIAIHHEVLEWFFGQPPPNTSTSRTSDYKGEERPNMSALVTFDAVQMKFERHTVIRREECPACGSVKRAFPERIRLKKNAATEHQFTFNKYKHHISLRTGIIDELKAIGNHPVIHAASADHLFVPNLQKKDLLQKGLTQKSWGKGCTPKEAKTGALCEALERYSGVFRGNEFRITKSAQQLGEDAIPINDCLNFSDAQYANREQANETAKNHDWVPVPLSASRKIEWTPVWSLTNQKFRYLPTAYCYYGYPLPADHRFCRADSNGNAAGETLEHAISNGFLELVERDCTAMWWFNRAVRPGLRIETFPDPYLHELVLAYKKQKREIWVLDLTNDFGIPCFTAISAKKSGPREMLMGFGAHFNPGTALIRAVTEMNQFLAVRIATARSISTRRKKDQHIGSGPVQAAKYLRPDETLPELKFEDYKNKTEEDPYTNVKTCVRLAKERRMETFVLDQTRSDVGLPVVKVIVPGMRQIWRRFAPGRLYDVPVRLGWLKKSLKENELNMDRFMI